MSRFEDLKMTEVYLQNEPSVLFRDAGGLTLPSPKERVLKEAKPDD